jgi:hypothetical protein
MIRRFIDDLAIEALRHSIGRLANAPIMNAALRQSPIAG